jgi:hypothetical protein
MGRTGKQTSSHHLCIAQIASAVDVRNLAGDPFIELSQAFDERSE